MIIYYIVGLIPSILFLLFLLLVYIGVIVVTDKEDKDL